MTTSTRTPTGALSSSTPGTSGVVNNSNPAVNGDLLIAIVVTELGGGTITPPSGWQLVTTDTTIVNLGIFTKIAASEGASWTWSWPSSKNWIIGLLTFYTDSTATNKFVAIPEQYTITQAVPNTGTHAFPSAPMNRAGELVIYSSIGPNSSADITPSGMVASGSFTNPPSGGYFVPYYKVDNAVGTFQPPGTYDTTGHGASTLFMASWPLYYSKQQSVK